MSRHFKSSSQGICLTNIFCFKRAVKLFKHLDGYYITIYFLWKETLKCPVLGQENCASEQANIIYQSFWQGPKLRGKNIENVWPPDGWMAFHLLIVLISYCWQCETFDIQSRNSTTTRLYLYPAKQSNLITKTENGFHKIYLLATVTILLLIKGLQILLQPHTLVQSWSCRTSYYYPSISLRAKHVPVVVRRTCCPEEVVVVGSREKTSLTAWLAAGLGGQKL